MKKKVIGISCGEKTDSFLPLQYVPTDYVEAVKIALINAKEMGASEERITAMVKELFKGVE